jgi:putative RNA 2'-phosphotransferase
MKSHGRTAMNPKQLVTISKYLSKHLRHEPEALGLTLEPGGWVNVKALLAACADHDFPITRQQLDEVVSHDSKQRYSFDEDRLRIRANQGHSTPVDLQLEEAAPPPLLYHGTGAKSVAAILVEGLNKMARHHVHLSLDVETAIRVGQRHGTPVVFVVEAAAMHAKGVPFFRSENDVWLVDAVPPAFLRVVAENG